MQVHRPLQNVTAGRGGANPIALWIWAWQWAGASTGDRSSQSKSPASSNLFAIDVAFIATWKLPTCYGLSGLEGTISRWRLAQRGAALLPGLECPPERCYSITQPLMSLEPVAVLILLAGWGY